MLQVAAPLALVIDDDESDRQKVVSVLGKERFEVHEARNGREGLEQLGHRDYSLVILDILMPKVDGFDVMRALRSTDPAVLERVVVVSNTDLRDLRVFFPRVRVLQKPIRDEELAAIARTARDDAGSRVE